MKNKKHIVCLFSILASIHLWAEGSINDVLNKKFKDMPGEMSVINSVKIDSGETFAIVGNKNTGQYAALLVSKDEGIAFAVSDSISLSDAGLKSENKIKDFYQEEEKKIRKELELRASNVLSEVLRQIDAEYVFAFNGASVSDSNIDVYLLDVNCGYCKNDIKEAISKKNENGEKFVLIPIGMLGEPSISAVASIASKHSAINGNFNKFKEVFLSEGESATIVPGERDEATAMSEKFLSTGLVQGVPFKFVTK